MTHSIGSSTDMASLFDDYNEDDIYNAFKFAETGSFNNPWIRTVARKTPGGSTAFGPVQITGGLLDDFYKNERGVWDNNQDIASKLKGQATLFNHFGNEPDRAGFGEGLFDYGGTGFGFNDEEKGQYKVLAQDMMRDMWKKNKNKKNAVDEFINAWRGKTKDEDSDYYKRFNKYLRSL
jgi:hypothetical protein